MERKQKSTKNNVQPIINHNSIDLCLNQVFRPKEDVGKIAEGTGNCYTCKPEPINNQKCKNYTKISLYSYGVKERDYK